MSQDEITTRLKTYKASELSEATGLDKSTISRHSNGGKMSAAALAMWHFFFQLEDIRRENKTLKDAFRISNS